MFILTHTDKVLLKRERKKRMKRFTQVYSIHRLPSLYLRVKLKQGLNDSLTVEGLK